MREFEEFARKLRTRKYFAANPTEYSDNSDYIIKHKQHVWQPPILYDNIERYITQARNNMQLTLRCRKSIHYRKAPPWLDNSLKQLIQLSKSDIIIKNADKNMGVTVQDRLTYESDCLSQLNDIKVYQPIDRESITFADLFDEVSVILNKYGKLHTTINNVTQKSHTQIARYILQMNNETNINLVRLARFYLIYKVHKTPTVGRPICGNINTVTYYASKYIDRVLQPIMKLSRSYVESTQSFIANIDDYTIPSVHVDKAVIVCADVTSLYPNIPIDIGIDFMYKRLTYLYEHNKHIFHDKNDINFICELTKWTLENNYIEFGDKTYKQTYGTAMGTPVAVVFANLFLQHLETIVASKLSEEFPLMFKRYIDDIFAIFKNLLHATKYIEIYNSIVDTIKITHTISSTEGIFLDTHVLHPENSDKLSVKLFQKPQNMYLYLHPKSFHNDHVFKSIVNNELNRILLNNTDNDDYTHNKQLFYKRLLAREYTPHVLDPIFDASRDRMILLKKVKQRLSDKKIAQLNNDNSQQPIIPITFKITCNQESKWFKNKFKKALELTSDILDDFHYKDLFSNLKQPIISFTKSPSMRTILTSSKYSHKCQVK